MSVGVHGARAEIADESDLDVKALGRAVWRRKFWFIAPTILAAVGSIAFVSVVTPRYKSETRILFDGRENVFLRPDVDRANPDRSAADQEALSSQVQLVQSRQLAADVIDKLNLTARAEFDPTSSPLRSVLAFLGLSRDLSALSPIERAMEIYYERLTAFPIERTRVIGIEFQSHDAALAADVANAVAQGYLTLEQGVKQDQTRAASRWLSGEIDGLRTKVADAEAKVEQYRSRNNLFIGTNNATLSNQQLGELATQYGSARGQKADAESRARLIREMLKRGEPIEVSDVLNSELVRRLSEQRATLRAQLAEQSSTLLGGHPRIKELKAQIGDLDSSIRGEAERLVRTFESDAKIAGGKVDALGANLELLKRQAGSTNEQDVELRALEREARAQRDLLESYLAKYREATTRDNLTIAPTDARVISRANVSTIPYFPKKGPIVIVATMATLLLAIGFIVTSELLSTHGTGVAVPPARLVRADVAHPALGVAIASIEALARRMRQAGEASRRVVVFNATPVASTHIPALTLARSLARQSRVVLVDLSFGEPSAVVASATPPAAVGLAEAVRGDASFGDMIVRDQLSRVHLVAAGKGGRDIAAVLVSPRFAVIVEALSRTYDHVILNAGTVEASNLSRLAEVASYAVLSAGSASAKTVQASEASLRKAGFADCEVLGETMLSATAA